MKAPVNWFRRVARPRVSDESEAVALSPEPEQEPEEELKEEPEPEKEPEPEAVTSEAEPEPEPEPVGAQGDLRDLATNAPHVGQVRPAVTPTLKQATALRVPSVIMDGLSCGPYFIAGASHAGSSHLLGGTTRQDSYDFVVTTGGRLVVAVADGLGSRLYSQLGARLFGEHVVQLALEEPGMSAEAYLTEAAERTGAFATTHYGVTVRDIGFVALVAVFDAGECTVARIGDVSAFARTPEVEFSELFLDGGDPMNLVSTSLPGAAVPEVVTTRADRVVLTTDGMAGDIRLSPGVREWLAERWSGPVSASLMNDSLRFRRQGSHDDRTAVVVWRRQ